jgi:hypothetical protein
LDLKVSMEWIMFMNSENSTGLVICNWPINHVTDKRHLQCLNIRCGIHRGFGLHRSRENDSGDFFED